MAEVALAVVLVVGAGLLLRSFRELMTVDAASIARGSTFGLVLPGAAYPRPAADRVLRPADRPHRTDSRRVGRGRDDGASADRR